MTKYLRREASQVARQLRGAIFPGETVIEVARRRERSFTAVRRKMRIFVVLGYGCHLTPIVRAYLDRAAERIKSGPAESWVITTGGRTAARTAPGISEAALM